MISSNMISVLEVSVDYDVSVAKSGEVAWYNRFRLCPSGVFKLVVTEIRSLSEISSYFGGYHRYEA